MKTVYGKPLADWLVLLIDVAVLVAVVLAIIVVMD